MRRVFMCLYRRPDACIGSILHEYGPGCFFPECESCVNLESPQGLLQNDIVQIQFIALACL